MRLTFAVSVCALMAASHVVYASTIATFTGSITYTRDPLALGGIFSSPVGSPVAGRLILDLTTPPAASELQASDATYYLAANTIDFQIATANGSAEVANASGAGGEYPTDNVMVLSDAAGDNFWQVRTFTGQPQPSGFYANTFSATLTGLGPDGYVSGVQETDLPLYLTSQASGFGALSFQSGDLQNDLLQFDLNTMTETPEAVLAPEPTHCFMIGIFCLLVLIPLRRARSQW